MTLADPIVNVTSAAALYSQIAGPLAGFAFTGLTFKSHPADQHPGRTRRRTGQRQLLG